MNRASITFNPIGVIRSEHVVARQTPIQPAYAKGCKGQVELFPEYAEGLRDLDGFSHIYLIFYFNQAGPSATDRQAVSSGYVPEASFRPVHRAVPMASA